LDNKDILSSVQEVLRISEKMERMARYGRVRRDETFGETIYEPILSLGRRSTLRCTQAEGVLRINAENLGGPFCTAHIIMGRLRTEVADSGEFTMEMHEITRSLRLLASVVRRVGMDQNVVKTTGLMLHWLKEAGACACLQAGGIPDGRGRAVIRPTSPLMPTDEQDPHPAWRPTSAMQKAIDGIMGGSVLVRAMTIPPKKAGDRPPLVLSFAPPSAVVKTPEDPVDGMRRMARILPKDEIWGEAIS
jgi:hypothetical protein